MIRRSRLWFASLVAAVILAVGTVPAHAASPSYVALGDSFGAGVGSRLYYEDQTCFRSNRGYAALLAADYGLSLTLAACSGATTMEVVGSQISTLADSTDYVTITVGGNDLGFAAVLTACASPGWLADCAAAVAGAREVMRSVLPSGLASVYAAVKAAAPHARVVVTGYPKLFNGEDCSLLTFFTPEEEAALNQATGELNRLIRTQATAVGFEFVAVARTFDDHAWCDDRAWINGPSYPIVNSFHPNRTGHRVYADLLGPVLVGSDRRARTGAGSPAALALGDVPADGAPRPFAFGLPDLDSAATARAAKVAGVTQQELDQIRSSVEGTQEAGVSNAALDRLDAEITERAAARR